MRPPRVLTRSFPSCPHHLYYAGFRAVIGLRLVWQPYPPALAYKWFLCVGAKVCLHLPSALLNLAARTLVFSYILPTAGWIRDLHSLERAPAGRTRKGEEMSLFALLTVMQKKGLEPSRYCYHTDLNRARLPIPPLLHVSAISHSNSSYYIIKGASCQSYFYIF